MLRRHTRFCPDLHSGVTQVWGKVELVGNRIIGGDEPLPADRRLAATPGAFGGGGNGKAGWPRRG